MARRVAGIELLQAASRYAGRSAIVEGEAVYSYSEIDRRSNALANHLLAKGCRPGQRVAVWLQNSHELAESFFGVEKGGFVRVALDSAESGITAQRILEVTEPVALVASGTLLRTLAPAAWPAHTIAVGPDAPPDVERYEDAIAITPDHAPQVEIDDEALCQVSVRTVANGQPISIQRTHRNWRQEILRNALLYLSGWYGPSLQPDEVYVNVQQLMYGTATKGFYPLHLLGYPVVMLPRFDAEATLVAIERHRVTTTFMVPGMVERLQARAALGNHDFSSLRRVVYGGAPISRGSLEAAIDTFGDVLVQVYGRADGAWPIAILSQTDHRAMRDGRKPLWGSCGRPAPLVEMRLVGPDGMPVEPGAVGEIVVRGDTVTPAAEGEDGWCHTTDLATQDDEGYLRIVGRTDDMINTGSYHVYPSDVEEALRTHPAVRDACVLGVPDPRWGEAIKAYVVAGERFSAGQALEEELIAHCKARLPRHKAPKSVDFVDPAEAAAHGGLSRGWLRQKAREGDR